MILRCTDLTEGQIGRWYKCLGYPPEDSFRADDGKIVAWSPYNQRLGRAEYRTASNPECAAYFAMAGEVKQKFFFILRQVTHLRLPYKNHQRVTYNNNQKGTSWGS